MKMIIKVNGKKEETEKATTLSDFIKNKRLKPDEIVIEHNAKVVRRDEFEKIVLKHNDILEILTFVGGG